MSHTERHPDPLHAIFHLPLEYGLKRDAALQHAEPHHLEIAYYAKALSPDSPTARSARLEAVLRINANRRMPSNEGVFPAYLEIPRTLTLYTAIDNWFFTFSLRSVCKVLHPLIKAEQQGGYKDYTLAFLRLLVDHALLPEHVRANVRNRDLSQLTRWLEDDFQGALRLWQQFYRHFYRELRFVVCGHLGSAQGEEQCWEKWLHFLQVPYEHGHHEQRELAHVSAQIIGPIYSTAEYVFAVKDGRLWNNFLKDIPQASSPASPRHHPARSASASGSSSGSTFSSHSSLPHHYAHKHSPSIPESPTSPRRRIELIPGRSNTFPIDPTLLEEGALHPSRAVPPIPPTRGPSSPPLPLHNGGRPAHGTTFPSEDVLRRSALVSPRKAPLTPAQRREREQAPMIYVTNLEKERKEAPMRYVTNLEEEREKDGRFHPAQRTEEERERKRKGSWARRFLPARMKGRSRTT